MDFTMLTHIEIDGAGATLRPAYDRVLCTFTVQIHKGGVIFPLGLDGAFAYADEPLKVIGAALAGVGLRDLTDEEAFLLYAGLIYAKGGADWELFCRRAAQAAHGHTV